MDLQLKGKSAFITGGSMAISDRGMVLAEGQVRLSAGAAE